MKTLGRETNKASERYRVAEYLAAMARSKTDATPEAIAGAIAGRITNMSGHLSAGVHSGVVVRRKADGKQHSYAGAPGMSANDIVLGMRRYDRAKSEAKRLKDKAHRQKLASKYADRALQRKDGNGAEQQADAFLSEICEQDQKQPVPQVAAAPQMRPISSISITPSPASVGTLTGPGLVSVKITCKSGAEYDIEVQDLAEVGTYCYDAFDLLCAALGGKAGRHK
jgi:hypothetical protein